MIQLSAVLRVFAKIRYKILHRILLLISIDTSSLLSRKHSSQVLHFSDPSGSFNPNPTNNSTANAHFANLFKNYPVHGHFLLELRGAFLLSKWAIPVTQDGHVIIETSGHLGILVRNIISLNPYSPFPEVVFLLSVLLIRLSSFIPQFVKYIHTYHHPLFHLVPRHGVNPNTPAFSHWVFENLPQLKHFDYTRLLVDNIKILINNNIASYQSETLSLLGISAGDLISHTHPFLVRSNRLFITRLPYIHSNHVTFDPIGRSWVQQRLSRSIKPFLTKTETGSSSIIAISRYYCDRRKLLNENDFLDTLTSLSIQRIFPEKCTELEKYSYCAQAKSVLMLPSGSAYANMIFSQPGTRVVDVLPSDPSCFLSVWFLLSFDLNFDYCLILVQNSGDNHDFRQNNMIAGPSFAKDIEELFSLTSDQL